MADAPACETLRRLAQAPRHVQGVPTLYLLYLDESGVPDRHPSQTSHFALAGIAIPARTWTQKRDELRRLLQTYGISDAEVHVAWLIGPYPEQRQIAGFDALPWEDRRRAVERLRRQKLHAMTAAGRNPGRQLRKQYRATSPYVHLTLAERQQLLGEIVALVASWTDAVLFGEVADKRIRQPFRVDESAYEQVVTRFEAFLARSGDEGVVAYDHNETVVERFVALMARFQAVGGIWRRLDHIAGHPFFVGSHTSDMIQVADVIAYVLRRCVERREDSPVVALLPQFDHLGTDLVGLRHYRGAQRCGCPICRQPRRTRSRLRPRSN